MRILYLAPRIPYPALDREHVRPYHQIRFLSLRHDVDLVAFGGNGSEWDARRLMRRFCPRVQILPPPMRPVEPASARHVLSTQPLAVRRYQSRDLMERLDALSETRRYDVVFAYGAAMAPYGRAFPDTAKLLDLVEVSSLRWRQYGEAQGFLASAVFRREAARLRMLEVQAAKEYQRVILASDTEAEVLRGLCPGNRRIVSVKTPAPPHAPLLRRPSGVPTILFAAHMDHLPNQHAAVMFAKEVFPKVKARYSDAIFRIAGRNPGTEVRALASIDGVMVDDRVRDLRELYANCWVAVVPHRVSRGVRNELLESLTFGVPTLASSEAFVGIDALPGTDLIVADSVDDMADRIGQLFESPTDRDHLGFRARRAMLNNYSHWSIALRLEEVVEAAHRESLLPA
ncbi:MAG: glycosyltransferase family 4 protein [Planctomycetes bacterium]|nr:glycosyltransferase family 4 protein [Planctomycetota bacterium]